MRLRRTTKIALFIPVEFINEEEAPGVKKGGVVTVVRPEVELVCTAGEIPEKITVDLTGMNINDVATISSVELPAGTKPTIDRDFVIANISAPTGLATDDDDEGEDEVAADEVEVVGQEEEE
jgi:large subunit ribosomal protein L25